MSQTVSKGTKTWIDQDKSGTYNLDWGKPSAVTCFTPTALSLKKIGRDEIRRRVGGRYGRTFGKNQYPGGVRRGVPRTA